MGTLKHLSSVRRRANVHAGFHVKMSGKPINVRRIARTRTNAIHRTVWITVVQHAAPDQKKMPSPSTNFGDTFFVLISSKKTLISSQAYKMGLINKNESLCILNP